MKRILLFIIFFMIYQNSFSQWVQITAFSPAQSLQEIEFYDSNTGYTVSPIYNGSTFNIHKTTNGGQNWTAQSSGFTSTRLMAIEILHPDTVFISGNFGIILKTVDGGQNWIQQPTPDTTTQLWGLEFINSQTGYCSGSAGTILKTTNGGTNWNPLNSGSNTQLYKILFLNENTGYVSGAPAVLKTTNAGQSWVPLDVGVIPPLEFFRDIKFTSDNTGYIVSDVGRVRKTTDAGANWTLLTTGTTEALFSISFPTPDTGYACGFAGTVIKTTDAGATWTIQPTPLNEILPGIVMTGPDEGYICSWTGKILKTTNGGIITSISSINNNAEGYSLKQNYPNPFNPKTIINFQLSMPNMVNLTVYDAGGREVSVLVNDELQTGSYEISFDGSGLSSGIYFYTLSAGDFKETRKMILMK